MNREEIAAVLGLFTAAWPHEELSAETAQVWLASHHLGRTDPGVALSAAHHVIAAEARFPTMNAYLMACQAEARRTAADRPRSLGGSKLTREETLARVAEARAVLAAAAVKVDDPWYSQPPQSVA